MVEHLLGGRYRLDSVLGTGGMAVVWRGVDVRLDRAVAVKVLNETAVADPSAVQRFDREARTVARLSHPNVVAIHDVGTDHGRPYLVMELIGGESLATVLGQGPLDVQHCASVASQVIDALAAAHAAGVIHRDIKPGNIMLDPGGAVKVCDFGIARTLGGAQHALTGDGDVLGTSWYMAPECVAGAQADARSDLYSLGCVLYAMLAGRPPFPGDNPITVASQHVEHVPEPVSACRPDVPGPLAELVDHLLAKEPENRPAAAEVRNRLAAWRTAESATPTMRLWAQAGAAAGGTLPPTRAVPLIEQETPARARPRTGPGRTAIAAMAVALTTAAALGIGTIIARRPEPPRNAPNAGAPASVSAATPSPTADAATDPLDRTTAVRAVIAAQVRAGGMTADAADDVTERLNDLEEQLADNRKRNKAGEKLRDLRKKLDERRRDGTVTAAAADSIEAMLLPLGTDFGDHGDED